MIQHDPQCIASIDLCAVFGCAMCEVEVSRRIPFLSTSPRTWTRLHLYVGNRTSAVNVKPKFTKYNQILSWHHGTPSGLYESCLVLTYANKI